MSDDTESPVVALDSFRRPVRRVYREPSIHTRRPLVDGVCPDCGGQKARLVAVVMLGVTETAPGKSYSVAARAPVIVPCGNCADQ
jgi:hypothetical protein